MAPKVGSHPFVDPSEEKWINVTWMPHTALSQTSHVCLTIRSAHAVIDAPAIHHLPEWRVRIGVYGIAGLPLVPLRSHTTSAPLSKRRQDSTSSSPRVSVSKATHDCAWDCFVHVPIRWRDLPRDAYLHFEILTADQAVYQTTMPFFSKFGKLSTGLRKLALDSSSLDPSRNYGLVSGSARDDSSNEDDPIWKAVVALDQLGRMEERNRTNPSANNSFGQVPCVPWLDSMVKERAMKVIADAVADGMVSRCQIGHPLLITEEISRFVSYPTY